MTKAELRKEGLRRQKALSSESRGSFSSQIADHFFSFFDLTKVRVLHVFIPIDKFNEIDTRLIIHHVWRDQPQIRTVVPRVEVNEIRSLRYDFETELAESPWGIDEPTHDELVDDDLIDMVLVPGLVFDQRGHRVGYGKGFYDRFLSRCRSDCVKLGLNYFDPVGEIEDVHEGDVRVDFVITPDGVRRTV